MNKQTILKYNTSKIFEAVRVNAGLPILVVLNLSNGATHQKNLSVIDLWWLFFIASADSG